MDLYSILLDSNLQSQLDSILFSIIKIEHIALYFMFQIITTVVQILNFILIIFNDILHNCIINVIITYLQAFHAILLTIPTQI